jgi:hypothetical protein
LGSRKPEALLKREEGAMEIELYATNKGKVKDTVWVLINGVKYVFEPGDDARTITIQEKYHNNAETQFEEQLEFLTNNDKGKLLKFYKTVIGGFFGPWYIADILGISRDKASALVRKGIEAELFVDHFRGKKATDRGKAFAMGRIKYIMEELDRETKNINKNPETNTDNVEIGSSSTPEIDKAVERFTPKLKKNK